MVSKVDFVSLNGDALTRGILHGQQLQKSLQAFTNDGLCRLNFLSDTHFSLSELSVQIKAYRSEIKSWLPDLAQEIEGLALGSKLSSDIAWLLQLRREVLGYSRISSTGDCTTLSSIKGKPILAQTVDLNGNLEDHISVINCQGPRYSSLLLSFAGLLGYLGLNNAGLAIGLNLVLGGTWGIGVPPYLVIRHLLDNCANVQQALEELMRIPLSSSRSFTLCDSYQTVCIECFNHQKFIVKNDKFTVHTNHFLHPDFSIYDEINIFAKNSSINRFNMAHELACKEPIMVDDCFSLFARAPIYVADNGDIRRERTVAAVVLLPEQGMMLLRPGGSSLTSIRSYSLSIASCDLKV